MPNLLERAIAEINDLQPDIVVCSGDLTTFGFKEEYAQARRYLDRIECESLVVDPGQPRLAQRRLRALRGAVRRAQLGAAQGRRHASSPSTRPSPTSTTGRSAAAATAGSRSSSRPSRPSCASSCSTTTCCRPGHRPRAERRLRRRRRDRVPAARRRPPRALRAQARAVRVEAREPVRRQHRHRLVAAPARQHAALLQRRRGRGHARRGLAPVPVPRPGADHPVLDPRPASTRSTPAAIERRGDARAGEGRRADRRRALRARRARRARVRCRTSGRRRDPRRRDGEAARRRRTTASRSSTRSSGAEVVVDLSDEPVLGPARAPALGLARARGRAAVRRRRLPLRSARCSSRSTLPSIAVIGTGKRVGKTAVDDAARAAARARPQRASSWRWGGAARPSPSWSRRRRRSTSSLARSRAGRHAASDHLEIAALAGVPTIGCRRAAAASPARSFVSNVARGRRARAARASRTSSSSTAAAPRSRRSTSTVACSSSRRRRRPTARRVSASRTRDLDRRHGGVDRGAIAREDVRCSRAALRPTAPLRGPRRGLHGRRARRRRAPRRGRRARLARTSRTAPRSGAELATRRGRHVPRRAEGGGDRRRRRARARARQPRSCSPRNERRRASGLDERAARARGAGGGTGHEPAPPRRAAAARRRARAAVLEGLDGARADRRRASPADRAYQLARRIELDLAERDSAAVEVDRLERARRRGARRGRGAARRSAACGARTSCSALDVPIDPPDRRRDRHRQVDRRRPRSRTGSASRASRRPTSSARRCARSSPRSSCRRSTTRASRRATALDAELTGDPTIAGFLEQCAARAASASTPSIERALTEGWSMVLEGVHLVPGLAADRARRTRSLVHVRARDRGRGRRTGCTSTCATRRPAASARWTSTSTGSTRSAGSRSYIVERARARGRAGDRECERGAHDRPGDRARPAGGRADAGARVTRESSRRADRRRSAGALPVRVVSRG